MGYASSLMDLARLTVRDAFGQTVTYTPIGGEAVSLQAIVRTQALQLHPDAEGPPVATTRQVCDFRSATLLEAGIVPRTNDVVAVASGDAAGTWRVVDVAHPCDGTVLLILGRRS